MKLKSFCVAVFITIISCSTSKELTRKEALDKVDEIVQSDKDYNDFFNHYCTGVNPIIEHKNYKKGKDFVELTYLLDSIHVNNTQGWWSNDFCLKVIFDSETKEALYIQDGASGLIKKLNVNNVNKSPQIH